MNLFLLYNLKTNFNPLGKSFLNLVNFSHIPKFGILGCDKQATRSIHPVNEPIFGLGL
jgi:hypothetical protein